MKIKMKKLVLSAIAILLFSSCTTFHPIRRPHKGMNRAIWKETVRRSYYYWDLDLVAEYNDIKSSLKSNHENK
jgi:hypothetical protein